MIEKKPAEKSELQAEEIKKMPLVVTATRWLFVLLGGIWLVFGVWSITRIGSEGSRVPVAMSWTIAILMVLNALLLLWIGWGIGRGNKIYYYFGILILAGNIFLTFTDEFGFFDLMTLIINVALLVLLVATRAKYLEN